VASTIDATYWTRRDKPSSSVGDLNVGTVELDYTQTRRLISQPVQLHRAHESIFKSLAESADHMKSELDEAAGDVRATWWTAQRLLHSRAVTRSCTTTPSARH